MALNFPQNPLINDPYESPNGTLYIWDGEKWVSQIGQGAITEYYAEAPVVVEQSADDVNHKIDMRTVPFV